MKKQIEINAIILKEPSHLEKIRTTLVTELKPDEVLLKVHRIGICGTDLHAFRGRQPFFTYPRILGHELGVEVLEIGSGVTDLKIGDRCAVEPYFNANPDQAVRAGKTNCGENLSVFGVHEDGGMREFIVLPARYLHPSDKLSYEQLALIETLSIGFHAIKRADVREDDKVLVIGAGPIGLATIQFAKIKKAKIAAMDLNQERLDFSKNHLNVEGLINAKSEQVLADIRKIFDGDLPTVVLDATGHSQSMKNTFDYVAFGGKIVFIGLYQGDFTFFDPLFHKKEITLMASRNSLGKDFDEIISLVEKGILDTGPWVSHRVFFQDLPKKFESFLDPKNGVIKAMVELK
ncbi:zinc-binding alcohol dehydrogenase family protein [Aquiflexum gelatinilyticum]|uniref:zinc-binding alcohol dehydrogenase family protein n=1 Tax=Aquiflexum gelatinilyticum TaxID=2961943 RepID=UPI00216740B1|nr:zinc-binding alcohol dehydrogenase family protein [Aquiflexum gelatinilyticum]MCS4436490.1 zinc-binding alcohol dehydrogenase family protein [Aquiflexum gelatinilyticum]